MRGVIITSQCTTTSAIPKQEHALSHSSVFATVLPAAQAITQPAGTALSVATALPTPVVFKQLTQPRTYKGSISWKDYKSHFERLCKVNNWTTAQDKAQNLTLALAGPAVDILKDIDESVPNAYDQTWQQIGRRFGHTDAPRDAQWRSQKLCVGVGPSASPPLAPLPSPPSPSLEVGPLNPARGSGERWPPTGPGGARPTNDFRCILS